jgi:hypothetical protein
MEHSVKVNPDSSFARNSSELPSQNSMLYNLMHIQDEECEEKKERE